MPRADGQPDTKPTLVNLVYNSTQQTEEDGMLCRWWREAEIESETGTRFDFDYYIDTKLGLLIYWRGIRPQGATKDRHKATRLGSAYLLKGGTSQGLARLEKLYQYKIRHAYGSQTSARTWSRDKSVHHYYKINTNTKMSRYSWSTRMHAGRTGLGR